MSTSIEALVFNCGAGGVTLSLLVNNLWAWFAFVTTAVSFWVKSRPLKADSDSDVGPYTTQPVVQAQYDHIMLDSILEVNPVQVLGSEPDQTRVVKEPVQKCKYTKVYYRYEEEEEVAREGDDGGGWEYSQPPPSSDGSVVGEEWRGRMKAALAVAEWYRYQDRRVLDGSVVRLWDINNG